MKPHDNTYIGSHDIAAICGVHPWMSPVAVYMRLMGLKGDAEVNEAMEWGLKLQPSILAKFQERTGLKVYTEVHGRDKKHPFIGSTIDGIAAPPHQKQGVDAKLVRFKGPGWGDPGTDEVPEYILIGMQWHMHVHGLDHVTVAALFAGQQYEEFKVVRHPDLIGSLIEQAIRFKMDHIDAKTPPPMDASESSREFLKAVHPKDSLPVRAASAKEIELMYRYGLADRISKQAEKKAEEVKNQLKALIGDGAGLSAPRAQITYKRSRDTGKIDWEKVAAECAKYVGFPTYQEILDKCRYERPGTRRFIARFESGFFDGPTNGEEVY